MLGDEKRTRSGRYFVTSSGSPTTQSRVLHSNALAERYLERDSRNSPNEEDGCRVIWLLGRIGIVEDLLARLEYARASHFDELRLAIAEETEQIRVFLLSQEAVLKDNPKGACLNPAHGDRLAKIRGLCHGCYGVARELVRSRRTTWSELEARGRATPSTGKARGGAKEWLLGDTK